jgi:predicted Zn-dependent protease with MMP-like domain
MATLTELCEILMNNFTPEEIVEQLGLTSQDLVGAFRDEIEDNYDALMETIRDDLGYYDHGEDWEEY